ncbi:MULTISPECIES: hypothetical protein [unclassified Streptococcus]|uniref:hypothetical protein n=1 Tax=unclassified Streptococcus TaxID=2608887 RepID=UPI00359E9D72
MTTDEIKRYGNQLADMLPRIEMIKGYSNALILANRHGVDATILRCQMHEAFVTFYAQAEQLYRELDLIAFDLMAYDDEKEQEAIRKHGR